MKQVFGPYSPVRQAGHMYFVSGQVGIDSGSTHASNGIAEQTKQVISNIQDVLEAEGLGLHDVVKTTVYLRNIADFTAMNEVYEQYFHAPCPARSTVGVADLPRIGEATLLVEIEAVAYRAGGAK